MKLRTICRTMALLVCATSGFAQTITSDALKALQWRSLGPTVFGGRVADVAGVPGNPNIFYIAHSSAGLFKTTNGGVTFISPAVSAGNE